MATVKNHPLVKSTIQLINFDKKKQESVPDTPTGIHRSVLLASSSIAGGAEALATYPFEYAKTRVQLHKVPGNRHNPFSVLTAVAKTEGLATIYTGCSTTVLGSAWKVSVRFVSFHFFRERLADSAGSLTPLKGIVAGFAAGLSESIIAVTPTERLKTVLIDSVKSKVQAHNSGILAFKVIVQTQGVAGLYQGLLPTVLKQSITQAVKMGSYNMIKERSRNLGLPQHSVTTFLHGALAGAITVYVTQPLDTIKTAAQSGMGQSFSGAYRKIVLEDGIKGLWSGSTSRTARLVFSSGILYTVYENVAAIMTSGVKNELFIFIPKSQVQ